MPRFALVGVFMAASLVACPVPAAERPPLATPPVVTMLPAAAPGDVASVDAIVGALYDVISGPAGQPRDWRRMRSLFVPGGQLMAIGPRHDGNANGIGVRVLQVNDYVALSGPLIEKVGFHEHELARRTERFGHLVNVFSTYEGRTDTDPEPMRGINSIQLMNDGQRWWIISVLWEDERPDNPLPKSYLPKG